jgi:dienelactone hydrolase
MYSVIPVWKSSGPIFAVGGYDDQLWSSGFYVDQVAKEMHAHGRHDVTALTYAHAGHLLANAIPAQLTLNSIGYGQIYSRYGPLILGGSPKADEAALEDSWPRVLRFLAGI